MPQTPLKVCVIGPKSCGKSTIANFLSGSRDSLVMDKYDPTVGVRILETEVKSDSNRDGISLVELWDASGDYVFESCWRALMTGADGVILVYNPDAPAQDQQMNDWFDFFVRKNGLKDEQCIIFAHRSKTVNTTERFRPPPLFSRVTAAVTTADSGNEMKVVFENFIKDIEGLKVRK